MQRATQTSPSRPAVPTAGQGAHVLGLTASEIEEYIRNLWYMDEDPFLYTTD